MIQNKNKVKISQEIVNYLREQIKIGYFPIESQIPIEKDLMLQFHASRVSIREALAILANEGLIYTIRGKGSFVKARFPSIPHQENYVDFFDELMRKTNDKPTYILFIMELRKILECGMVELAALRATPKNIIEMKINLRAFSDASKEHKETVTLDYALHYSIAKASKNEVLSNLLNKLHNMYYQIILSKREHIKTNEEFKQLIAEHERIIRAIEKHDPQLAKEAMSKHLERSHHIAESILIKHML